MVAPGVSTGSLVMMAAEAEPADNRLKANYRIVVVRATIARNERVQTIVTAPQGFKLVTLGLVEGAQVGFRTETDYVG